MGRLIDGIWKSEDELTEEDRNRSTDSFRDWTRPESRFAPESGRYHLYISRACPWAHGAVLVRKLLGLEDVISMDVIDPYREDDGWQFTPERPDCSSDSIHGSNYLREVYTEADDSFTGRVSVPVLWDRKEKTIVNNESIEIMEMLATAFEDYSCDVDLYPEERRERIDAVVEAIYEPINSGVYSVGFADSQPEYNRAVESLFEALEHWEGVLAEQRFLVSDRLSIAYLRLFPTLIRFDLVYHTHFKCNLHRLVEYPNLWGYTRALFQQPGVAETVNVDHIKEHYYRSQTDINPKQIVPAGPEVDFTASHNRE